MSIYHGQALVAGAAEGPVLRLREPLSFWGGLDPHTGRIIDRWHPDCGLTLTGALLFMESGRGSSSSSTVLAESLRLGTGPAGLILTAPDAILLIGCLVAFELYGAACPLLVLEADDWQVCAAAKTAKIARDGQKSTVIASI